MKNFVLMACLILVSACGTTGVANQALLSEPIPSSKARLIVTRDDALLYMAASATVSVNGTNIQNLGRGGSVVYDVPKGRNYIAVTTLGSFGRYSSTFEAKAGKTYKFEVSPRSEAWGNAAAFGLLGDAVSAHNSENSGYFQIMLKDIK